MRSQIHPAQIAVRITLVLLALSVPLPLLSQVNSSAVPPFVFSEDEGLPQSDFSKAIPKSQALRNDAYLNAPITRLEYLLTKLEEYVGSEDNKRVVLGVAREGFEQQTGRYPLSIWVTAYARYEYEIGRVIVGYRVENLGAPRKPMRQTCDSIIGVLETFAPQETSGLYWYQNTILGALAQKPHSHYGAVMEMLANNIVHTVQLESSGDDRRTTYYLGCMRLGKNAPIVYNRRSSSISR